MTTSVSNHPLFQRVVSVSYSDFNRRVDICYKPAGYWSGDSIRVVLQYDLRGKRDSMAEETIRDGDKLKYSIKYASGGTDAGVDDLDSTEAFIAALGDAREMVKVAQALANSRVPFISFAQNFMTLDMAPDSLLSNTNDKALILIMSDKSAVFEGNFWHDEAGARDAALHDTPDREIVVREATEVENNFWFFMYHATKLSVYGTPDPVHDSE